MITKTADAREYGIFWRGARSPLVAPANDNTGAAAMINPGELFMSMPRYSTLTPPDETSAAPPSRKALVPDAIDRPGA